MIYKRYPLNGHEKQSLFMSGSGPESYFLSGSPPQHPANIPGLLTAVVYPGRAG
nr:hypothetical protein [Raoultella ornithinolytica]UVN19595.1 hypothetical protein [Klebsiella michiganensis]UWX38090.1 hypothetical protein KJK04_p0430 [Klebsiella quasipneumoniae]